MGPVIASSRSLFSTLIPPGLETEFFSIYQITDKGSGWVGPLVFATLVQTYGTGRGAFVFTGVSCLIGIVGLLKIDFGKARADAARFHH